MFPRNQLASYNLEKVYKTLYGNKLFLEFFEGVSKGKSDAIVTYVKK